jgi:hypothetical protein
MMESAMPAANELSLSLSSLAFHHADIHPMATKLSMVRFRDSTQISLEVCSLPARGDELPRGTNTPVELYWRDFGTSGGNVEPSSQARDGGGRAAIGGSLVNADC